MLKKRIVGIITDSGQYYESHEYREDGVWYADDCFDLTEDFAADRAKKMQKELEVDVSDYLGLEGNPIASFILLEQ